MCNILPLLILTFRPGHQTDIKELVQLKVTC